MSKPDETPKEKAEDTRPDQQKKDEQKTALPGFQPQGIIKSEWENLMGMFGEKEEPK